MLNIMLLLSCLSQEVNSTVLRQLKIVVEALLCMQGRVSMLGISRWTEKGGSYRTIQRFFNQTINWPRLQWLLLSKYVLDKEDTYFAAGDLTTVTKSGKKTYGLGKYYSSIYGKAIPGLSFLCLSLVSVNQRTSYPLFLVQNVKSKKPKPKPTGVPSKKRGRGRPKGSRNKMNKPLQFSEIHSKVLCLLKKLIVMIDSKINLKYFVYDGEFGNESSVQVVKQVGLELISKLYRNSALHYLNEDVYLGSGAPKKYGNKIDYQTLPQKHLKKVSSKGHIQTMIYQMPMRHKSFSSVLNIVILMKRNLRNGKVAHVVLFSSDLSAEWEIIIDYYSLRFQIEFNFRDAKQYWGLEDFMNIKEIPVSNGANLAMFMVSFSKVLLSQSQDEYAGSVLDLKSRFHSLRYINEALKLIPQNKDSIINSALFTKLLTLGRIHCQKKAA